MLAFHEDTKRRCALKVIKVGERPDPSVKEFVRNEASVLKAVEHPNIVKLLDFREEVIYTASPTYKRKVAYIAMEAAENGDLIKLITSHGRIWEEAARYYFNQLVDTLEHIHFSGYWHLDIKPDNILFDSDYNLKLCDFGFSSDRKIHCTRKGTLNYAAPEIFSQEKYCGPVTDIFSAGIILFIMVTGHPPFCKPDVSDMRYKHIYNNNIERFWELVCTKKDGTIKSYSDDFKDLVNSMLSPYPHARPSLAEVRTHPWMQGATLSPKGIKTYFDKMSKRH